VNGAHRARVTPPGEVEPNAAGASVFHRSRLTIEAHANGVSAYFGAA